MARLRENLQFASLEDALADARELERSGHRSSGKWDLSQAVSHLTAFLSYGLDGYPKIPLLLKPVIWIVRHTIAKKQLRKALATGKSAEGISTIPQSVYPPGGNSNAALDAFARVIERWSDPNLVPLPSPLFGKLDRETSIKLHCVHCAHHLGFFKPNPTSMTGAQDEPPR